MTCNTKKDKKAGILYTEWTVADPGAVLVLIHGLGAHSLRWSFMAESFLENNISSYALELKGFGHYAGMKEHGGSFDAYFKDIKSLHGIVSEKNPGKKIFLAGESMGALISFMYVLNDPERFDGVICMAPVFLSRLKLSAVRYSRMLLAYFIDPGRLFPLPFTSDMCTRDSVQSSVMEEDPLEHRSASAKVMGDIFLSQVKTIFFENKVSIPVLFMVSGKDKIVSSEATVKVFRRLRCRDKSMVKYPEMYHALSIDTGKEKVFADILEWVSGRIKG